MVHNGEKIMHIPCEVCSSTGKFYSNPCYTCKMTGHVRETSELKLKIPTNIKSGEMLRVKGKGNFISDKQYGDLLVKVSVQNPNKEFKFNGNDVETTHFIPLSKAILGGRETVKTLYGKAEIEIPKNTQYNSKFILSGYGLADDKNARIKGDHIIYLKYIVPRDLNSDQKALWEEFAKHEQTGKNMSA
mmetsp:Transcript_11894/g.13517  ORF Transcript_11894/g.13517 Transcript_11894/m.13517 type:complete len:188 (-) Transcript_11894:16-579(-)